ncbi:MAG: aminoacyl-tRNA hydrolase [Burkholderiales bacterium]|nr:aminoacyl-tRNA hydrolase [Burkholderiales bacterium]
MNGADSLIVKFVVGLGNIGPAYEQTRHNVGFWFADELAWKYKGQFSASRKFMGDVALIRVDDREIYLLKPSTLMNLSGLAVAAMANFYKIEPSEILVVHDDLDLPAGAVKYKYGGGSAGHNGLKSITNQLGTPNYQRIRFGIDHPRNKNIQMDVVNYVLGRPSEEDLKKIVSAMTKVLEVFNEICNGEGEQAIKSVLNAKA